MHFPSYDTKCKLKLLCKCVCVCVNVCMCVKGYLFMKSCINITKCRSRQNLLKGFCFKHCRLPRYAPFPPMAGNIFLTADMSASLHTNLMSLPEYPSVFAASSWKSTFGYSSMFLESRNFSNNSARVLKSGRGMWIRFSSRRNIAGSISLQKSLHILKQSHFPLSVPLYA
jgi:hypothetical protein